MKHAMIGKIDGPTETLAETLETLTDELEWNLNRQERISGTEETQRFDSIREHVWGAALDQCFDISGDVIDDAETLQRHIDSISDALQEFAPPYFTFGETRDGYGYFPDWDTLNELPRVSCNGWRETGERPEHGEYVFVNDHGNTSLRFIDEHGNETELWGIV